jgi:uncharacterized repeat protein (TIGR03806 family)
MRDLTRLAIRALVVLTPFALAAAGCDSGAQGPPMPDMAVTPSPFGLDARPSNTTCVAPPRPVSTSIIELVPAFPQLSFNGPLGLYQAPGDDTRWFVIEQAGVVRTFPDAGGNPTAATDFLDISARVTSGGEMGFLGLAFDPQWQSNHRVYVSYTAPSGAPSGITSTISRFTSNDGGATLDPNSEAIILTQPQPEQNHNGGNIKFGPDGFLYIGFGDGGGGGDQHGTIGNGQDTNTLLGKMLRIDVNSGTPYASPASNPFFNGGGKPEIFAYGLRNPWRWSFDRATGELWCADVGQNAWEEVDIIQLGGNYGWRRMEGTHCYNPGTNCMLPGMILPLAEYSHTLGCSVTGGFVYRGTAIPSLVGTFIYGDYCSGRIWGLSYDSMGNPQANVLIDASGHSISSFGEGNDGELYLVALDNGNLYKIVEATGSSNGSFPPTLKATGCTDAQDATKPAAGLIPYDINAPLWSDGATKRRFIALPDGQKIHVNADGDWDLPVGTVMVKEFSLGGKPVETRLLVHHTDGDWAGYSYEWRDDGTDADLLPAGKVKPVGAQLWTYPNRADCLRCHTTAAGRTLGLETGQLHRDLAYPNGRLSPELDTLEHIGLFDAPLDQAPRYPTYDGTDPVDQRARAYVHANCSICHRPGGPGQGMMDFRFATGFKQMNACGVAPSSGDLGVAGALLFAPGAPGMSVMSLRMHAIDVNRMPPLATRVVDSQGTAIVDQWISGTAACPP